MACMCGDYCCWSCGPAQGNWKCPICGEWASEGCDHIADDGSDKLPLDVKPEFKAEAEAALKRQAEEEDALYRDYEDNKKYGEQYKALCEKERRERAKP